jgi:hypothetical protein
MSSHADCGATIILRSEHMDEIQAAGILKSLAAGIDPAAGRPVADVAFLREPDVVRALCLGIDSLETRARQGRRQSNLPRNAGKPWTQEEDERLLQAFDTGTVVAALTLAHERTRAGIEARLVKHGRLEVEQAPAARIR